MKLQKEQHASWHGWISSSGLQHVIGIGNIPYFQDTLISSQFGGSRPMLHNSVIQHEYVNALA